jgi:hypothetical protein
LALNSLPENPASILASIFIVGEVIFKPFFYVKFVKSVYYFVNRLILKLILLKGLIKYQQFKESVAFTPISRKKRPVAYKRKRNPWSARASHRLVIGIKLR